MDVPDREPAEATLSSNLLRTDSLSASMVLVVGLMGLQRLIGLVRNVLFCGLLSDDQLGRWSLANNFLLLAAPLVVLGVPGSFGRYVEHYRRSGQLRAFLRRTSLASLLAALVATAVLLVCPKWFAVLVYDDPAQVAAIRTLGVVLVCVIAFNFLVELFTALRLVRMVAVMQLASSLVFALVGCGLLFFTRLREEAVVIAFGISCLVATAWGLAVLVHLYRALPRVEVQLGHGLLWKKLLPFAGWIWTGNLIANLFTMSDQFMLKHLSGLAPAAADSLVGQYYSSRVVPVLLVGVATLLASSLLPHLIADWEANRRDIAMRRVNASLKLSALGFTGGGAAVLVAAPLLFGWILRGKYSAGLSILPATLTYCVWFSVVLAAYNYLLCVEKARLFSLALLAGLAANISLNLVLAPRLGLTGVVCSALLANGFVLALMFYLCERAGMRWDRGSYLAALLPLSLCLGGWPALAILLIVLLAGAPAGWLFDRREIRATTQALWMQCSKLFNRDAGREPAGFCQTGPR